MSAPPSRPGPLAGTIVVDLSRALAGPHATMMLGDIGACVIKVEAPGHGDDTRGWGPPFVGADDERESTYFLSANRNKQSIVLDLKDAGDLQILRRLVVQADVLVENFRPDDPQKFGTPICDLLAGMYGAYGVVAALHERERTGLGQVVRTSLLAAAVGVHAFQGTRWTVAGQLGRAAGNHHASISPYGLFRCADGAVQIAVGSEGLWRAFGAGFAIDPDRPGFASNAERVEHRDEVIALIEGVFASWAAADLLARLDELGIPAGAVRTLEEVYSSPQTASQGLVIEVEHDSLGPLRLPGPPLRFFDGAGAELTSTQHAAPPVLDQHGDAVRRWLSRTPES